MSVHCSDIETLAQTFLDDELAPEDADALDAHLSRCEACTTRLAEEATSHRALRQTLRPAEPAAAPAALRERLEVALDREDWTAAKRRRRDRWSYALPGAAAVAAAAALALFAVTGGQPEVQESVTVDAVRQHMRRAPIEVQGANVSPWVERHFQPQVQLPRFSDPDVELIGARLSHLAGRDAVQLYYNITRPGERHPVSVIIVQSAGLKLHGDERVIVGGRELWVDQRLGYSAVTYEDASGLAYVFASEMPAGDLIELVTASDLVLRVNEGLRARGR